VIFLLIAIYINMMEIREEIFISIIKGERYVQPQHLHQGIRMWTPAGIKWSHPVSVFALERPTRQSLLGAPWMPKAAESKPRDTSNKGRDAVDGES
jgi:hypothetical protein